MAGPAPEPRITLHVEGGLEQVAPVGRAIQAVCSLREFDEDTLSLIELCVVEAATNIVLHGFKGKGPASFDVVILLHEQSAVIEFFDRGLSIDSAILARPPNMFDPSDVSTLPESGAGLQLIRANFDVFNYSTEAGLNCMRLEMRTRR